MESLGEGYTHMAIHAVDTKQGKDTERDYIYIYNNDIKRTIFTKYMQEIYAAVQQITVIYR